MIRKLLCLPLLLLIQNAQALDVLGLTPGAGRAEVAKVLAPLFPAEKALKPSAPGTAFYNVAAYDSACQFKSCAGTYSERNPQTRNTVRSENVGANFTRKDRLESIRYERMIVAADGKCPTELASQVAAIVAKAGKPAHESTMRRGGTEIAMAQWAGCASGGECFMLESSCNNKGEATVVQTLSNLALGRQDR